MLLESQYSQFKSDLNEEKSNKGKLAFITEEKKDLLAIGADKSKKGNEKKEGGNEKKKTESIPVFGNVSDVIPKFEDD